MSYLTAKASFVADIDEIKAAGPVEDRAGD